MSPSGGILGISNWEEQLGHIQNRLKVLHFPSGLRIPWDPRGGTRLNRRKVFFTFLIFLLPLQTNSSKKVDWWLDTQTKNILTEHYKTKHLAFKPVHPVHNFDRILPWKLQCWVKLALQQIGSCHKPSNTVINLTGSMAQEQTRAKWTTL